MTRSANEPVRASTESPDKANAQPQTLAERLDAAQSGEEFGQVLTALFGFLDSTRHRGSGAPDKESE